MEYNFQEIEQKWRKHWADNQTYKVTEDPNKEKFYVLDMFPYPSGSGLHVGHPLGYIASDIYARYKRHLGFNVLHPMGYDSFGLPAEQYAIQTGQHPAVTTEKNIARYREQLDQMGFCYDWDREVRTSSPDYYRWTQWIFRQLYTAWYNLDSNKAESIETLEAKFSENGTYNVNAHIDSNWWKHLDQTAFPHFSEFFAGEFTATDWKSFSDEQKQLILMHFRLTYLADSWVNWCPELGTVLANDEVKDGVSERGGFPVERKLMRQWSMRITAYAERLLQDLNELNWSESIKEIQRNWIGKSKGASVSFKVADHDTKIEVFTTRPDTIFGVSFMVLAPEHALVDQITTPEYRKSIDRYVSAAKLKTERDRQADTKKITGEFTGAYALHPFTAKKIPVWIGDYVLASYGTGAVMAVPAGDQRDLDFANHFRIPVPAIFEGADVSTEACTDKSVELANSDFLNGLSGKEAMSSIINAIESNGFGAGTTNYRLRDAVFSRQRYWGEPFPVYYENDLPYLTPKNVVVTLPPVDKYLPTEEGEPPLARASKADWNVFHGDRMETNTMPGWAGSSWYFLRYMDPQNENEFCSKEKSEYWGQVDLYMGGAEHATGHLLYSRFWTKALYDLGYISFGEPFKRMINQGMILGRSSIIYRVQVRSKDAGDKDALSRDEGTDYYVSNHVAQAIKLRQNGLISLVDFKELAARKSSNWSEVSDGLTKKLASIKEIHSEEGKKDFHIWMCPQHVDIDLVDADKLDTEKVKSWQPQYAKAAFLLDEDGLMHCDHEVEKMSKSKYNVQTPDTLVERYGADTLRCYEMFLGPLEQSKPWDTNGISGVHNFLRKVWRLFHNKENDLDISTKKPNEAEFKALHKTIKKVGEDLDRNSWNTVVSAMMICVNELTELKCNKQEILEDLTVLLSPYAPHLASELWARLGHTGEVVNQAWPKVNEEYLKENSFEYPVSFNGKMRFKLTLPADLSKEDVEAAVLNNEQSDKYLEGKTPKKVIVVPKRIVNIVV
mgnify:CR=1 FL=1|jgi:leucyl-tRNA synthetase